MQKLFYLPESSTDFIFANIAEELGFIGSIFIVSLFVVFGYVAFVPPSDPRPLRPDRRLRPHLPHRPPGLFQHQR